MGQHFHGSSKETLLRLHCPGCWRGWVQSRIKTKRVHAPSAPLVWTSPKQEEEGSATMRFTGSRFGSPANEKCTPYKRDLRGGERERQGSSRKHIRLTAHKTKFPYRNAAAYLDNVVIHLALRHDHLFHLGQVLTDLCWAGLTAVIHIWSWQRHSTWSSGSGWDYCSPKRGK